MSELPDFWTPGFRQYLGKPITSGSVTLDVDLLEVIDEEHISILVDGKHLTVHSSSYTSLIPLGEGERIYHKIYGFRGAVVTTDGPRVTIEWDNGGKSVVALTDVERDD